MHHLRICYATVEFLIDLVLHSFQFAALKYLHCLPYFFIGHLLIIVIFDCQFFFINYVLHRYLLSFTAVFGPFHFPFWILIFLFYPNLFVLGLFFFSLSFLLLFFRLFILAFQPIHPYLIWNVLSCPTIWGFFCFFLFLPNVPKVFHYFFFLN